MPKLLVADDSTTIQRVVELTFAGQDIQVLSVGDGEQAIARIPLDRPDIVLADVGMPKRNGYEVSAFVKSRRELAHVPVLLLTGAFEPVDEARARDARSDGVIVKPFDPRQVVTRVRELLNAPRTDAATLDDTAADPRHLDDYFDRLDQALQTRTPPNPDPPTSPVEHNRVTTAPVDVPTIQSVLDGSPPGSAGREAGAGSDGVVDEITNRVLDRLSRGSLRDALAAIVREVLEERRMRDPGRQG